METDFFDIAGSVFQGAILAPYLFIFWLDYVLLMSIDLMKEKSLYTKKS